MLGAKLDIPHYVARLQDELARVDQQEIQAWADLVFEAWENEKFIFVFGNGGSGTTATHISEDLGKSSLKHEDLHDESKKRLKIISLTDNLGWILAVGNDVGYEHIFVQQLMNYGGPAIWCIAISGSGNSPNVLTRRRLGQSSRSQDVRAHRLRRRQATQMAHAGMHVPLDDMGMVESIHLALFHWVLNDVFARINREGRHGRVVRDRD